MLDLLIYCYFQCCMWHPWRQGSPEPAGLPLGLWKTGKRECQQGVGRGKREIRSCLYYIKGDKLHILVKAGNRGLNNYTLGRSNPKGVDVAGLRAG